ncbi:MAG: RNA-binding transcriptional accessory protein [Anaerolineae bacterium]|nr:RNA-binding transcriptional accessory protein [Anaerolineae bacterium]
MDIAAHIANELGIAPQQVAHTIALFDDGNTVPFIARYRKEATGELDETQIRTIEGRLSYLRTLEARKATVLKHIADQGKLTPDLEAAIRRATVQQEVEDLYLPYRPKRRTRATMARERGLQPLADEILAQRITRGSLDEIARPYLSDDVPTVEDAYAGACDIVAEHVAEDAAARQVVRARTLREGVLVSTQGDADADPRQVYRMYYAFQERLSVLPAHRLLAINRGERDRALKVRLDAPEADLIAALERQFIRNARSVLVGQMRESLQDAYRRLLAPAIARELRALRTAQAGDHAIRIFAANLRSLLLQPPLRGRVVMGLDPGYRTGCKVAVVDATLRYLEGTTIYPHPPQRQWEQAKDVIARLIARHEVDVIAVGNGTASRESEALIAEVIRALPAQTAHTRYVMVSEAGASVYSASELARDELPTLDVAMRGAVSIARRLQDPLAELVKIDPQSIGVGLYQHDVDQKQLGQALDAVVESVVNYVGVDLNTASPALLRYVAGINQRTAAQIVAHRDAHGPFRARHALTEVAGIGARTFEQAAGFLRIPGGDDPLDNTAIHPESYPVVERLLHWLNAPEREVGSHLRALRARTDLDLVAAQLEVGLPTLRDIVGALLQPGRDPRDDLPPPILRQDVLQIEDLCEGMQLQGTVRNVVPFGAFVDVGVKQDGLVHVSQLSDNYVHDPLEVVSPGDIVTVRVLGVDLARGRIALTMKGTEGLDAP